MGGRRGVEGVEWFEGGGEVGEEGLEGFAYFEVGGGGGIGGFEVGYATFDGFDFLVSEFGDEGVVFVEDFSECF